MNWLQVSDRPNFGGENGKERGEPKLREEEEAVEDSVPGVRQGSVSEKGDR